MASKVNWKQSSIDQNTASGIYRIKPLSPVKALVKIPSDKSISHRALLLASLSKGDVVIDNFLHADDTTTTLEALRKIGVSIQAKDKVLVKGNGLWYSKGSNALPMRESGTSIRLLSGILAAQPYSYTLEAAPSLARRPMSRITAPLRMMGASIEGVRRNGEEFAPLKIKPVKKLYGIEYTMPVSSAQVKSAMLLAGLFADGETVITQPAISRDHTERMLSVFGVPVRIAGKKIFIRKAALRNVPYLYIPSDVSSAAFFIALGTLLPKSELFIEKVGINPTRIGFIQVLKRMGAMVTLHNANRDYFEPYADILVQSSHLKACTVQQHEIPLLIDELPILFLCAALAEGTSYIKGVEELRVKETDRIKSMLTNLAQLKVRCGTRVVGGRECIYIEGVKKLSKKGSFKSYGDHRTAMSCVIAGLLAEQPSSIDDVRCISKSFPEFLDIVEALYKLG